MIKSIFGLLLVITCSLTFSATTVKKIAMEGSFTSCAIVDIDSDLNRIMCWGKNKSKIYLNGSVTSKPTPTLLPDIGEILDIATTDKAVCVVNDLLKVLCWGDNQFGALGNGEIGDPIFLPIEVPILSNIVDLKSSKNSFCAKDTTDMIYCWGDGSSGKFGLGTNNIEPSPAQTVSFPNYSVSENHFCASGDGSSTNVFCAGDNSFGQVGRPDTTLNYNQFQVIFVDSSLMVQNITVGSDHSCALMSNGQVKCWGNNDKGQLGRGNTGGISSTPDFVSNLTDVVQLISLDKSSCALLNNGQVYCWGDNSSGQLGDIGNSGFESNIPVQVSNLSDVLILYKGEKSICSITLSFQVKCWGFNNSGNLGTGDYFNRSAVTDITFDENAVAPFIGAFRMGYLNNCTIYSNFTARCTGDNSFGQLGTGNQDPANGNFWPIVTLGFDNIDFDQGFQYGCVVKTSGKVNCFGKNNIGQLGDGTAGNQSIFPVEVIGVDNAVDVITGTFHACAILSDATVKCWGNNNRGQLGRGTQTTFETADFVSGLTNVSQVVISKSGHFTCAIKTDGSVYCWGLNDFNQSGVTIGNSQFVLAPQLMPNVMGASQLALGLNQACALTSSGETYCWGNNFSGVLATGNRVAINNPRRIQSLKGIKDIQMLHSHACAIFSDDSLRCWGDNSQGQLGIGLFSDSKLSPINILPQVKAFGVAAFNTCAIDFEDNLYCWGDNTYGQLGIDNNFTAVNKPTQIINKK